MKRSDVILKKNPINVIRLIIYQYLKYRMITNNNCLNKSNIITAKCPFHCDLYVIFTNNFTNISTVHINLNFNIKLCISLINHIGIFNMKTGSESRCQSAYEQGHFTTV